MGPQCVFSSRILELSRRERAPPRFVCTHQRPFLRIRLSRGYGRNPRPLKSHIAFCNPFPSCTFARHYFTVDSYNHVSRSNAPLKRRGQLWNSILRIPFPFSLALLPL